MRERVRMCASTRSVRAVVAHENVYRLVHGQTQSASSRFEIRIESEKSNPNTLKHTCAADAESVLRDTLVMASRNIIYDDVWSLDAG